MPPRARMKPRAKVVLPAPRSPFSAMTSPISARAEIRTANATVAASSGRSTAGIAHALYMLAAITRKISLRAAIIQRRFREAAPDLSSFARIVAPPSKSVLDRGIGQDRLAGFVLFRAQDDLALAVAKIVEIGAGDILKLHGHQACLLPLALFAELDVADDGLEGMAADVIGDLVLVEALGLFDRLTLDLQIGVGPGRQIIAEGIDPLAGRLLLIALQKLHDPGEAQFRRRQPEVEGDDAVQHRAQRGLDRGALRSGHRAAAHLGVEPELMHRADQADAVRRVGSDIDDVGVLGLDRADDRRKIGRRRRVGLVVDDIEAGLFQIDAGPVSGVARRLTVIDRQRNRLQSELLLMGLDDLEKTLGDRRSRI